MVYNVNENSVDQARLLMKPSDMDLHYFKEGLTFGKSYAHSVFITANMIG